MTETKAKAPFICGPYYKEIFREMKTIGIIFCIAQTVIGLLENFGTPVLSLFALFTGTSTYRNVMLVYFFVAALNFLNAYIKRSAWDLRGSLPLKKRTIFVSHLAAALTWAAFIFVANYVGMLMGELLRLIPGVNAYSVPAGYIGSAGSLLHELVLGLILYGVITMLGSVVNKVFTLIIAGAVMIFVPILYFRFAQGMSVSAFTVLEHLLPIGLRARSAVLTVLLVLAAVAALVLAYIAFSKSQAETFNKPARTKGIHIAIGVGFAALLALLPLATVSRSENVSVSELSQGNYEGAEIMRVGLIIGVLLMLIGYVLYMWLSLKSFKKACKNLVFLPIAAVVIASALLFTGFMDKQFDKLDASVSNIDHVTIPSGEYDNGITDFASNMLYGSSNVSRGRDGSEKVKLTDEGLLRAAAQALSDRMDEANYSTGWSVLDDLIESLMYGGSRKNLDITLKHGGTWTVPVESYTYSETIKPYADDNKEFVSRFTDLKRFRGGNVVSSDGLGREFTKTLLAELESLSAEDRFEVLTGTSRDYDWQLGMVIGTISDELAKVTIASPTYDHVATVRLTEKLPKSRLMYMQQLSENARKARGFDEFTERLESADYRYFFGSLTMIGDGTVGSYSFSYWPTDEDYESTYRIYAKRVSALLAEIIKENRPIEGAEYVVGVNIDDFTIDTPGSTSSFGRTLISDKTVFVGVSEEQFEQLAEYFMSEPEPFDDSGSEWM